MRAVRDDGQPEHSRPRPSGPGPSKLKYRLERTWAKPGVRSLVMVYAPLVLLGVVGWRVVSDDTLRRIGEEKAAAAWEAIATRPEFALRGVEIDGGSPRLRTRVRQAIGVETGVSSLEIDVAEIRARVESLNAVRSATVNLDPKGTLYITIDAREAVALFRDADDQTSLIDAEGVRVGPVAARADHPRLPLVLGAGGAEAVHEVLSLLDGAPDLIPRLRAFVRVGERRWDIELEGNRRIMLPSEGAPQALARVMALHYGEELLDRDLAVIDMRVPERPTLRLTPGGVEAYRLRQSVIAEAGKDT